MKQLTINDVFELTKTEWLDECRKVAHELLRTNPSITVDDVTKRVPRPTYIHRNATGSIFNSEFKVVGLAKSTRKEANGRRVYRWALRNSDEL